MCSQGYGLTRENGKDLMSWMKDMEDNYCPKVIKKSRVKYHSKTVFNLGGGDLNSGIFQTVHKVL